MPVARRGGRRWRVEFDEAHFAEDLAHSSAAARTAGGSERDEITKHGLAHERLKRCEREGRDGTHLAGCGKIYIPEPDGPWGMVFDGRIDDEGRPYLACLAFGVRHPTGPGALSVYEVASRRLNA
jgi:hypothetical protein